MKHSASTSSGPTAAVCMECGMMQYYSQTRLTISLLKATNFNKALPMLVQHRRFS
ncbi:hypothetical protein J6590_088644 [Homalodisca vitripennis]|nr:hypothetical protein J6590_088644 [Homalodisca vitripennis]